MRTKIEKAISKVILIDLENQYSDSNEPVPIRLGLYLKWGTSVFVSK